MVWAVVKKEGRGSLLSAFTKWHKGILWNKQPEKKGLLQKNCGSPSEGYTELLLSVNGALPAILTHALELDGAVNKSEKSVVLADTNIGAGMDVGASLAN